MPACRQPLSRWTNSLSQTFGLTAPSWREPFGLCNHRPKACPERGSGFRVSESRRGYKLARSSLLVSTPQSRLTPCQLHVRGAFWFVQLRPKACPERGGGFRVSESRRGYKLARSSLLVSTPQSRLAPCQLPRKRWRLLVQCKHIVQCRTPRGAIVSMGLRGVQGGLRGEIEIFPGPPAKKHYIFPSFSSSQRFFTRKVATWLPWLPRPKPSSAPLARACAEAT